MSESDSRTSQDSTRVHLSADRTGHPTGVPTGFGRVNGGNQWYVEVFGERDGGMRDEPVVGVHDVGLPRYVASTLDGQPGADHRMPHGQRPRHHVGAELEFVRVLRGGDYPYTLGDFVGRRVGAGIGAAGSTAEHHDLMSGLGKRRRQMVHVASEPADHHRWVLPRHHQDLHGALIPARGPTRKLGMTAKCQYFAACRVLGPPLARGTRSLARKGFIGGGASRRVRRTTRRRGSSRRTAAGRARGVPTPTHRRSPGWRARAGARDTAHSRRRSPC